MANYVLVAGAWLGSWAWDRVVPGLREAGHGAYPLTLSGLADRTGEPAGQQTHVQDVVDEVLRHDLHEVVLVGHSYAGIPVGQAAARLGDRLSRVVFLDSNIPGEGESFVSQWPGGGGAAVAAAIEAHSGFWPPLGAADYEGQGLAEADIAEIVSRSTPHPGATLTEPAVMASPLGGLPATYVKCTLDGYEPFDAVLELVAGPNWSLAKLDAGHWPMFSEPQALVGLLLDEAAQ
ncbi:alpha/beta hydrolase [Streptomyces bambusae]|uniref:alpha/beta fold hydrolase n=1 Tax=Streptomyces bambusae TaxID=1550616 RepID=UPI001CFDBBAF|nr:alpha/beta hydrolase [Streptomyces bambusae]MCB5165370.1 alpha/beta hydrolase [Streptomyces bambusae]